MMQKKRPFIYLAAAISLLAYFGWWSFTENKDKNCDIWPVSISPFSNRPYVDVQIEGTDYQFMLDLGSKFELSLRKPIIKTLKQKKQLGQASWRGIKGNLYYGTQYQIPELKIGKKIFKKILITEKDDKFFLTDGQLYDAKARPDEAWIEDHNGFIGRPILSRTNLLLDFPNSQVCATNSLTQIKALGYRIETWLKIPFTVDRGIMLEVTTDFGVQKFVLDTGATFSVMDTALIPDGKLKERFPGLNSCQSSKFILDNLDFGETEICTIPWAEEAKGIHGVIGMDVLSNHIWYIDYKHKVLYVEKKQRIKKVN